MEKLIEEINQIENNYRDNSLVEGLFKCGKTLQEITEEQQRKIEELSQKNTKVKSDMDEILQLIKFYSDHNEVLDKVSTPLSV